jgi:hypothetical protein
VVPGLLVRVRTNKRRTAQGCPRQPNTENSYHAACVSIYTPSLPPSCHWPCSGPTQCCLSVHDATQATPSGATPAPGSLGWMMWHRPGLAEMAPTLTTTERPASACPPMVTRCVTNSQIAVRRSCCETPAVKPTSTGVTRHPASFTLHHQMAGGSRCSWQDLW